MNCLRFRQKRRTVDATKKKIARIKGVLAQPKHQQGIPKGMPDPARHDLAGDKTCASPPDQCLLQ